MAECPPAHTGINVTSRDSGLTVAPSGKIDYRCARDMMAQLSETISARTPARLELDLSGVTFMDSTGIAVLIRTHWQMAQHGGTLRAVNVPAHVRQILDAAGVCRLIPFD